MGSNPTPSANGYVQTVARLGADAGKAESYAYDGFGRIERFTDIRGASTWSFHYNNSFQLEKVVNHLGEETSYVYYGSTHQNAGMLWKVTHPGGAVVETQYNARGQRSGISGSGAYPVDYGYDAFGDLETMTTHRTSSNPVVTRWIRQPATGLVSAKRYDYGGPSDPGEGCDYTYTWDGRLKTRTSAEGVGTTWTYDSDTRDLTNVNYTGDGDVTPDLTFSGHDHFGRPGQVTEVLAAVSGVNDAETRVQGLTYEDHSGAVSTSYAANHPWLPGVSLTRNADDASGRPTGFQLSKTGAGVLSSQSYAYDALGRLGTVSSADFTAGIDYLPGTDSLRRLTVTSGSNTILERTHSIDMLGRLLGTVNKAPGSGAGTGLVTVSSVGHGHDSAGRRDDARREDGTWWDYGYNTRSEVTSAVKKTQGDDPVPGLSFGYQYDDIGNRTSATFGTAPYSSTITYTPNDLNGYGTTSNPGVAHPGTFDLLVRASSAVSASADNATVSGTGNEDNLYGIRLAASNSGGGKYVTSTITHGGNSSTVRTWVPKASVTPGYDADGNLTSDSRWEYLWDGENRLVRMTPKTSDGAPNVTLWFSYDYLGRRIGRKVADGRSGSSTQTTWTAYACDDWNVVGEWESTAAPPTTSWALRRTHLWGLDLGSGGAAYPGRSGFQDAGGVGGLIASTWRDGTTSEHFLPGYDANGNIISWTDDDGELLQRMDYDPFGNQVFVERLAGSTGAIAALAHVPAYGFSTKPSDPASDLLYYGYRYMDPVTGRWPSRDPIGERGGVNLYGFLANDSVGRIEQLGLAPVPMSHTVNKCEIYFYIGHSVEGKQFSWTIPPDADNPNSFDSCFFAYALSCRPQENNQDLPTRVHPFDVPTHNTKLVQTDAEMTRKANGAEGGMGENNPMAKDTMVLKNAVENALSDANKNKMLKYLCDPSAGGCCCKKVTIRIFVQNVPETRGSRDWLEANGYGGVEAASKAGIEFTADVDCTSYNSGTPGLANHLVTSKP